MKDCRFGVDATVYYQTEKLPVDQDLGGEKSHVCWT